MWADAAFDQVENAMNNGLCFSSSGSSQNEKRSVQGFRRFLLLCVKIVGCLIHPSIIADKSQLTYCILPLSVAIFDITQRVFPKEVFPLSSLTLGLNFATI